jgi:hypothetical protein
VKIGAELIAGLLLGGDIRGVKIGASEPEVKDRLGDGFVSEIHGRSTRSPLRLDYGFVEVTLEYGEEGRIVSAISLPLHRFVVNEGLMLQAGEVLRVEFSRFQPWLGVDTVGRRAKEWRDLVEIEQYGFREYVVSGYVAGALVISDPERTRDETPGLGDVWSVEIYSRSVEK